MFFLLIEFIETRKCHSLLLCLWISTGCMDLYLDNFLLDLWCLHFTDFILVTFFPTFFFSQKCCMDLCLHDLWWLHFTALF